MSDETVNKKAVEAEVVVETAAPSDEILKIVVPSGALNTQTYQSLGWFNPFLPQASNVTASGATFVYNITSSGYASQNNAGFVFQSSQYNTTQRGF